MPKAKYELVAGYIKMAGYSIPDIAKILGISRRTLDNKIKGYSDFSLVEAMKIKKIVGKTIEEIFLSNDVA